MSIQLASTDTLQVVLAAGPTLNQLPCNASYVDQGGSGANNAANTNGTTPVTLVGSPAASVERLVSHVSICNDDTASATVTVNVVRGGTSYRECKITLQPGYALYYDGGWKVLDANGNFLCNVTVSGGTITSNQGTAAAITAPWPVQLSNGTNAVGTSSAPLRVDPTGTTTQPVSVGNFPATQNSNITQLDGVALAGPTAWGTAPAAGSQVLNVNANIVSGGGGGGSSNITEWNSVALGSPSNYGTGPGAVPVIGVNAFITNLPATQPISGSVSVSNFPATQANNQTQLAGTALGAPSAYGTSPGAVSVQGVNAYVTNTVPVTGTFYQTTQPVSIATLPALSAGSAAIGTVGVTSLPAIPAGSNTIGAVNQGGSNWSFNLTEVSGTTVSLGQKVSASSIPVVIASDQSTISVAGTAGSINAVSLTGTSPVAFINAMRVAMRSLTITSVGASIASGSVTIAIVDGGGTNRANLTIPLPTVASTAVALLIDHQNLSVMLANAGNPATVSLSAALTAGSILVSSSSI